MKDIFFDFDNNDIAVSGGDFLVTADASRQNGGLFLMKAPVNVFDPQFGVGFEAWAPENSLQSLRNLLNEAKKQILNDGAKKVNMAIKKSSIGGIESVDISTAY